MSIGKNISDFEGTSTFSSSTVNWFRTAKKITEIVKFEHEPFVSRSDLFHLLNVFQFYIFDFLTFFYGVYHFGI